MKKVCSPANDSNVKSNHQEYIIIINKIVLKKMKFIFTLIILNHTIKELRQHVAPIELQIGQQEDLVEKNKLIKFI